MTSITDYPIATFTNKTTIDPPKARRFATNFARLPELQRSQRIGDKGSARARSVTVVTDTYPEVCENYPRPRSTRSVPTFDKAMTTLKIIVLGCMLAAVGITLKVRVDTPEGPQPLARAIVSTHLQKLRSDVVLP